jgi:hypothetical protein
VLGIRMVRHGKEHEEETFEPVEEPRRPRRWEPSPRREREPSREPERPARRKREKTPA